MEENKILVGKCPNCGYELQYQENDSSVLCDACDSRINVRELFTNTINQQYDNSFEIKELFNTMDSSKAALAYLDNFFKEYDFLEYQRNDILEINNISKLVERNKIKFANQPSTWVLEMKSIIVPLTMKIDGLPTLGSEIAKLYYENDSSEAYSIFDTYSSIIEHILNDKDKIISKLLLDLENYKKTTNNDSSYIALEDSINKFKIKLNSLTLINSIKEIPELIEYENSINEEIYNNYLAKGIDAEEIYKKALSLYMLEDDKSRSFASFNQIIDYKDSKKYIRRINEFFSFNKLYLICGRYFIFGDYEKKIYTYDIKKSVRELKNGDDTIVNDYGSSFFEIIDSKISNTPLLENVIRVINIYGSRVYFYIYDSKLKEFQLISYDINTNQKQVLDSSRVEEGLVYDGLNNDNTHWNNLNRDKFFIRKRIIHLDDKKGCSIFKKKNILNTTYNNYSIILVDEVNNTATTIVDKAVDIMDYFDDKLFYTYSYSIDDDETVNTKFYYYDLNDNTINEVLDQNCILKAIKNNKIIYVTFNQSKTCQNVDLHIFDLKEKIDILLEKNIYSYITIIEDKIYYTVGNESYSVLFSIDFDGNNRTEVMKNSEDIISVSGGWIYLLKGCSRNDKTIKKISSDGTKQIVLATLVKKVFGIRNSFLYYVDIFNDLYSIRIDGKNKKCIASNIDINKDLIITRNRIYYLKDEIKEYTSNNKRVNTKSLYSIDLEGNNLIKHEFDVKEIKKYSNNGIFILKQGNVEYIVGTPINKKKYEYEVKLFKITKYLFLDEYTHEIDTKLILGLPNEANEVKGCFRKKDLDITYEELPIKYVRVRDDVAHEGDALKDQIDNNISKYHKKGCFR